jgi:hypothetical protein
MEANELRIGSYVSFYPFGIHRIENATQLLSIKHLKPITLTEEWLLNFGFEYSANSFYEKQRLAISIEYGVEVSNYINSIHLTVEIKYVHQLQNLYFALTGEELTIKDKNDEDE